MARRRPRPEASGAELGLNAPGFVTARRVVWREVRNADLPPDLDVRSWLAHELEAAGFSDAVALITSRDIARHHCGEARVGIDTTQCLVTLGLSNGERVGQRQHLNPRFGTINMLVRSEQPLSDAAMIETLSIAVEARTVAVLEAGIPTIPDSLPATGTGTDCVVVASPLGYPEVDHAGLHTPLGEAIGKAVLGTLRPAVAEWLVEFRKSVA